MNKGSTALRIIFITHLFQHLQIQNYIVDYIPGSILSVQQGLLMRTEIHIKNVFFYRLYEYINVLFYFCF